MARQGGEYDNSKSWGWGKVFKDRDKGPTPEDRDADDGFDPNSWGPKEKAYAKGGKVVGKVSPFYKK